MRTGTRHCSRRSKNLQEMQLLDSPHRRHYGNSIMEHRHILIYPEPVLKTRAQEIDNIDLDVVTLAQDMEEAMYKAPGVGLAAPQVGSSKRLILVDPTAGKEPGKLMVVINPVIVESDGKAFDSEMCLSVPEVSVDVPRSERIIIQGVNMDGKEVRIEAEGFLARIFQHEIDHLNGRVILDYASTLKRAIYLKKKKKGKI